MPRYSRPQLAGYCVHVVTRGNARATVFHTEDDYTSFMQLIADSQKRVRLEIFAWCLMPNHVHLVLRPSADADLGKWMHWLLTTHVQRHRVRHETTGRVWQGRYKAFPIQADAHLIRVLRYVERNPVRASLAQRAQEWRWSSARERRTSGGQSDLLAASPVPLPVPWLDWVNTPLQGAELSAIRTAVERGKPLGDAAWTRGLAERLNLLETLTSRGRPRNF